MSKVKFLNLLLFLLQILPSYPCPDIEMETSHMPDEEQVDCKMTSTFSTIDSFFLASLHIKLVCLTENLFYFSILINTVDSTYLYHLV